MHVSANIIRFPETPAPHHVGVPLEASRSPAEVVEFPQPTVDSSLDERAQQHGQFHAAHRIVTRLADQLEAIGSL